MLYIYIYYPVYVFAHTSCTLAYNTSRHCTHTHTHTPGKKQQQMVSIDFRVGIFLFFLHSE